MDYGFISPLLAIAAIVVLLIVKPKVAAVFPSFFGIAIFVLVAVLIFEAKEPVFIRNFLSMLHLPN